MAPAAAAKKTTTAANDAGTIIAPKRVVGGWPITERRSTTMEAAEAQSRINARASMNERRTPLTSSAGPLMIPHPLRHCALKATRPRHQAQTTFRAHRARTRLASRPQNRTRTQRRSMRLQGRAGSSLCPQRRVKRQRAERISGNTMACPRCPLERIVSRQPRRIFPGVPYRAIQVALAAQYSTPPEPRQRTSHCAL